MKSAVFVPGEGIIICSDEADARKCLLEEDPTGERRARLCYANSCGNCGGELDANGDCANYCNTKV